MDQREKGKKVWAGFIMLKDGGQWQDFVNMVMDLQVSQKAGNLTS
jgi:hypothetical protein